METLKRRVGELENMNLSDENITVIRKVLSPSHLGAPMSFISDSHGGVWVIGPDETERDFIERASNQATRNEFGTVRLIANGQVND